MSRNSYEMEYYGFSYCSRCGEHHRHNEPCWDLKPDRKAGCVACILGAVAVIGTLAIFISLSSCNDADARRLPSGERVPSHVNAPASFK